MYKGITRSHVIWHVIYSVFIMTDPNKNSKETYEFFRHSVRLTLHQVINYLDTFKSKSDQYELERLDWSGRYIHNYLDLSLLDNILNKTTVTSPGTVVLV